MTKARATALSELKKLLPAGELRLDEKTREAHAGDKWFAANLPDAVALPRTEKSVAAIARFAFEKKIPLTARGAGYGYVGSCVPLQGGISLSLARMKRIKEINAGDFVGVVQPGVITKEFQDAVEAKGLYYPPDPASRADCSLGGNIATNAGGPRCLKYGVTRDYVLGMNVVLADGTLVKLGGRTHKNKSGFDLHRLFVGSEGMLGIVTEATLKLLPLPPYRAGLSIGFPAMKNAIGALHDILGRGFLPCALELADAFTLAAAEKRTGSKLLSGSRAHLIVELDGQERAVKSDLRELKQIVKARHPKFIRAAMGSEAVDQIWALRREFSYSLRDTGLTKLNQDITVPRSRLDDVFKLGAKLKKKHGLQVACFGHAGDGNIHVNIMVDQDDPTAVKNQDAAVDELFKEVLKMDGVITGEHGIGIARLPWWPLAASEANRDLHTTIKRALDPKNILNPGKFA